MMVLVRIAGYRGRHMRPCPEQEVPDAFALPQDNPRSSQEPVALVGIFAYLCKNTPIYGFFVEFT
jgi:hypothetical protein